MNKIPAYKTEQLLPGIRKVRFLFESKGNMSIIKIVEYTYVRKLSGKKVYNLGFGDYNEEEGLIIDDCNSNNGDMRKVFRTVLSTVPLFFAKFNDAAIWVQGSDNAIDYKNDCAPNCTKKCDEICKNYNRRIRAYRYYVDKNFQALSKEYLFLGHTINGNNHKFVNYIPGSDYHGILVFKKK